MCVFNALIKSVIRKLIYVRRRYWFLSKKNKSTPDSNWDHGLQPVALTHLAMLTKLDVFQETISLVIALSYHSLPEILLCKTITRLPKSSPIYFSGLLNMNITEIDFAPTKILQFHQPHRFSVFEVHNLIITAPDFNYVTLSTLIPILIVPFILTL